MANKNKMLSPKIGRINLLIMRAKGDVINLSLSPFILIFAFIFAIIFIAFSIIIINRYYVLFYDYRDLSSTYQLASKELNRLQNLYSYQSSVAMDYANIMNAMNMADPQNGLNVSVPAIGGLPTDETEVAITPDNSPDYSAKVNSLKTWASLFPEPSNPPQQLLDIEKLQISGRTFRFQLTNTSSSGQQAQGRILLLFSVEADDGSISLLPYPEFDINSNEPNFNDGPGYNIRSSKIISGRLNVPPGGQIIEMIAIAMSRNGHIVLKKSITP